MSSSRAFVLIELIVTVIIMMTFLGITLTAYPVIRSSQAAKSTEQLIQSELHAIQQRAIHRETNPDCLNELSDPAPSAYSHCSEIGLLFSSGSGEVAIVANSYINDQEINHLDANDTEIGRFNLPDGVISTEDAVFMVIASPPTVRMLSAKNNNPISDINPYSTLTITALGSSKTLYILPYGQVTIEQPGS